MKRIRVELANHTYEQISVDENMRISEIFIHLNLLYGKDRWCEWEDID